MSKTQFLFINSATTPKPFKMYLKQINENYISNTYVCNGVMYCYNCAKRITDSDTASLYWQLDTTMISEFQRDERVKINV